MRPGEVDGKGSETVSPATEDRLYGVCVRDNVSELCHGEPTTGMPGPWLGRPFRTPDGES